SDAPDENRIISIVGAVGIGADLTENGLLGFLLFFVGINITIGIFNLLPVLPLDGGHVVVATYERVRELFR
ncbi:MAG TPA: zinc metalloprotease, partial [Acidimicrobiaceae bacterium]|nr:zinc metalloprotease [Acidimicrobiaceae bacterium]